MKINYLQHKMLALYFPVSELKFALAILKSIYAVAKLPFVKEAIDDITDDLLPRKIPFVSRYHVCENCTREIDEKVGDNFIHYQSETTDKWFHRTCPPLKENRPN